MGVLACIGQGARRGLRKSSHRLSVMEKYHLFSPNEVVQSSLFVEQSPLLVDNQPLSVEYRRSVTPMSMRS